MIRFAVCDDEKFMLDEITVQLSLYMEKRGLPFQIKAFPSGSELLESGQEFAVIFLDIQMKAPDGMETAGKLRAGGYDGLIIFITVLRENVFDSFEVGAYDYLVKPLDTGRFCRTMDRVMQTLDQRSEKQIAVKSKHACQIIPIADIVYCEVLGRKIYVHQKNGEVISYYERLEHLASQMDGRFYRCHRSYLVNLDYVRGCRSGAVMLTTDGKVPVSRLREKELTQALLNHMKERRRL